ncbi:MAG: ribonuclease J, partial [Coriobacteriales bacterium]|nr:ribonuclease J [Coriobacteriales bacterium]
GNEKSVSRVINHLSKIGVDIYDKDRSLVHVSGHAGSEELKFMLSLVRPKYFMPVHGEAMHLRAHARLAEKVGVSHKNIFILDNGDTLEMFDGKIKEGSKVESGVVYVDGTSVGDTSANVLQDRHRMGTDGVLTYCVYYKKNFEIAGKVRVAMYGIPRCNDPEFMNELTELIAKLAKECIKEYRGDNNKISKYITGGLSKAVFDKIHRRPLVIPIVQKI